MTFQEVRESHEAIKELYFSHPEIKGSLWFDAMGKLNYIDENGGPDCPPIYLSDFDRDDWYLIPQDNNGEGNDAITENHTTR